MTEFPQKGLGKYDILEKWIAFEKESGFDTYDKSFFSDGLRLVSSAEIPWGDEVRHTLTEAYSRFMYLDDWHSKGVRNMHTEIIAMMGDLFHNDSATGNITTGGTESNLVALFTAKSRALSTGKIKAGRKPSIVLPTTMHYSFFKGCYLFDIEPIVVPPIPGTTYKMNAEDMRKAVRDDTIAIAASAGNYPYGVIDPIDEIGKIALENDLYFHVDGCVGGLILPFLEKGEIVKDIPEWDFRVKGVSSISADFHKNGMLPPPCSCIIFRDKELFNHARKIAPPRGTLTGTRAAGPIATAWTMIKTVGVEGFVTIAKKSWDLSVELSEGAKKLGLLDIPDRKVNFILLYSNKFDLMPVITAMLNQKWVVGTTPTFPPIGMLLLTWPRNGSQVKPFLADLAKYMPLAEPIKSKADMKVYGETYPEIFPPPGPPIKK